MRTQRWLACALALGCARSGEVKPTATEEEVPPAVAGLRTAASVNAVDDLESAFKRAIHDVGPAVVSIYSTKTIRLPEHPLGPLFGGPLGGSTPPGTFEQQGLGSGIVIDRSGYVLTSNHVVEGAEDVRVRLPDRRELDATVVGTDPPTDLALIKIEGEAFATVELGDSDVLEVGDWVLAIGSPFGLSQTVSAGIVSAVGRGNVGILDYEDFVQTDAAVNLGNSGGPLVDLGGRVVGINTAIASSTGGSNGIAFAVPISIAKSVVEQLRARGKVSRGQLGVVISELTPQLAGSFGYDGRGVLVQDVKPGTAAATAGVKNGDIVTSVDGQPVDDVSRFRNLIARTPPGTKIALELWHDGATQTMSIALDTLEGVAVSGQRARIEPTLGLGLEDASPRLRQFLGLGADPAVVISRVDPGTAAARAGVMPGDVLEQIGDDPVTDAASAAARLLEHRTDGARLRLRRGEVGRYVFLEPRS